MPKLSITLAAAALSITFAPAAQAYSTEPAPNTLRQISQVTPVGPQTASVPGTCTVQITPILASILGLHDDWREDVPRPAQTSLACVNQ